ncbi:hypothetical protein Peur_066865 [Populus x canadensis]
MLMMTMMWLHLLSLILFVVTSHMIWILKFWELLILSVTHGIGSAHTMGR